MEFRTLQTNTGGTLFLNSMPGRYEPIAECFDAIERHDVSQIICLASDKEIEKKSPDYVTAIAEGRIPAERICFPVSDYGTPEDVEGFYELAREVAERLKSGENLLAHCAGGIGRTGMFAGCVLKALGLSQDILEESGSGPEDEEQEKIIRDFHLEQPGECLVVEQEEQSKTLRQLTIADQSNVDFSALERFTKLEDLRLENLASLTGLSQIPSLPRLKMLSIVACTNLVSLEGFVAPSLSCVNIYHCTTLKDYTPLVNIGLLTSLNLQVKDRLPTQLGIIQKTLPELTVFVVIDQDGEKITKCYESWNKRNERFGDKLDKFLGEEEES